MAPAYWKILKALLGLHAGYILLHSSETPRLRIISNRHKLTHRFLFLFSHSPTESLDYSFHD